MLVLEGEGGTGKEVQNSKINSSNLPLTHWFVYSLIHVFSKQLLRVFDVQNTDEELKIQKMNNPGHGLGEQAHTSLDRATFLNNPKRILLSWTTNLNFHYSPMSFFSFCWMCRKLGLWITGNIGDDLPGQLGSLPGSTLTPWAALDKSRTQFLYLGSGGGSHWLALNFTEQLSD